ncbi:DUF4023 domain-containing protein [Evansella tamaricis]|uniref:DUF4023 domain-containing protein n=1 Tax=Evansella tamaricis TaxID=2069301 RepID=A0ABS6JJU2_9BACI|nr:DUF4023 domain-containing protein [Evansella tamaricis]MBU9712583.1 DUF4023 domain-containing protein [Evansella tamaricis]
MDNTHDYVQKLHEKQEKDERNKARQGHRQASQKLPNKKHSTNK